MSGFISVALSLSSSYPVFLSPRVSRARVIFYRYFPCLLTRHLSSLISCLAHLRLDEMVLSSPFRPTPSRRLFPICLLALFPRPRAWDALANGRFAAAGGMPICLFPVMSCRSLACARSLLRFDSSCGAVPSVSCCAICPRLLDCFFD